MMLKCNAALRERGPRSAAAPRARSFRGPQLLGVGIFFMCCMYITKTCKICALATAEQHQKYIQTDLIVKLYDQGVIAG